MSMPPSGVKGAMDEEAAIEAEIQLELESINLGDGVENDVSDDDAHSSVENELQADGETDLPNGDILDIPNEIGAYIKSIQEQSNRFERELLECDSVLNYSKHSDTQSLAVIPYEDQSLLIQLAKERGCTLEEYQRQILEEIENDELILEDELADLIDGDDPPDYCSGSLKALTENGEEGMAGLDGRVEVDLQKAVEEGMNAGEVPGSQDLVPVSGHGNRPGTNVADMQKMLREQLEKVEAKYQERINKIKKDEEYRRDEEDLRQRRIEEARVWKKQEIEREEQKLAKQRQAEQKEMKKYEVETRRELEHSMKNFESEMAKLQTEAEEQKKELEMKIAEERRHQAEKREQSAVKIQSLFRGYRIRKDVAPMLKEKREQRQQLKYEERIKEVEVEIERRKEEQNILEQKKREKEEEEKKKDEERKRAKEEERRQRELEKKQKEEEKRRLKELEERKKQEEKKRKEEEKQRKKEEERKRKEEEKQRKEEEKKRKEEEAQRKKEEKRLKEEEEKRKQEERKKQIEDEKEKQREEDVEKRNLEEENIKTENNNSCKEAGRKADNNEKQIEQEKQDLSFVQESVNSETEKQSNCNSLNSCAQESDQNLKRIDTNNYVIKAENKPEQVVSETEKASKEISLKDTMKQVDILNHKVIDEKANTLQSAVETDNTRTPRSKTPRSARKCKLMTPRKSKHDVFSSVGNSSVTELQDKTDCLPDHLEEMRLHFIKQCLPWSKVANEPWKLKTGISKRPLRRPSSAKKLPVLAENIIIEAGKVSSLKQRERRGREEEK